MKSSRSARARHALASVGLVLGLVTAGSVVLATSASAAALTVTSTADVATNFGACGNTAQTTSSGSLREAVCAANNAGATSSTITVAAGTYSLTNGELQMGKVAGSNITLNGAGAASTILQGNGSSRIFNLDANLVGNVSTSISGVTITGGSDSTFGGGGIIAGSTAQPTGAPLDALTVTDSFITGNHASGGSNPAGGLSFSGGRLTITNSTISNNTSNGAQASGLWYRAEGTGPGGEGLTISGTTFSGNSVSTSTVKVGGALEAEVTRGSPATFNISNSRFLNNTVTGSGAGTPVGGAIWAPSGVLNVTESTFTGNSVAGGTGPKGGAIDVSGATVNLHYNRFIGNTGASGQAVSLESGTVDATDNWWGCNTGPGTAGCDSVAGSPTVSPRLVLTATSNPATIVGPNATSGITGALTTDSLGGAVGASNLHAFAGLPVAFTDPLPSGATLTTASANISSGSASTTYNSQNASGPGHVLATLDNGTATATVTVNRPPSITSANAKTFTAGTASTFTVTTTGYPAAAITKTGTVPPGMTFTDNGNGTATLAGTPTAGGVYPLSLTANNGVAPNATQTLNVTVNQAPTFTSAPTATFQVGTAGSFSITTTPTAYPTPVTITETGTVPAGLTFTDNGNGTATLAGTPAAGSGGTYTLNLKAANGISPDGTQTLTATVNQAPAVTTNPADQTVNAGASVSFSAAGSGFPAPTVQWQRSTDGGGTYTNLAGATSPTYTFTAAGADNGNKYRAVFSNISGSATSTAATLTVHTPPTISSANHTSFAVGAAGSFTVTTAGFPNPTLTTTGTLPAWVSFTDNGNGTATLAGTPPTGSGGQYAFTINADNGTAPSDSQAFTLTVTESPTITSADHTSFQVGTAGSFPVTTSPGYPAATTVSKTGTLPSGVTFTPDGSGGATLAGTPAAGTGGSYPITITAGNGASPPATQSFTLTVTDSPQITSADHATFTVGTAGTFAVTSSGGGAGTAVSYTGTLPSGVTFTPSGSGATLAGTPAAGTGGTYPLTITASDGVTADDVQNFTLTVNQPPAITSADADTFTRGAAGSFTVTTTPGVPASTTITKTGSLPAGVSFTDNGDGTATIAGTPTVGGSFPITITASNGVAPDDTQAFTLTVNQAPDITSADHTTFTAGTAGSFTVTTSPAADTVTISGDTLPSGVSFTDNGDGTGTLAGTPAAGTGGTYNLSFTATNATGFTTQSFTLMVYELASFTSADHDTFTIGSPGSFTVTTAPGYPTATTITKSGALPSGVSFTDNGDGTATLGGAPAAGSDGSYPLTLTAANAAGNRQQSFTLTVVPANASPVITSADHATFGFGNAGSFPVTTTAGYPTATTVTETGTLPSGVTFTDNGDGTATLAGTPTVSGSFPITITASNGATPDATQSFTLTVTQPPAITSANHTTFTIGSAGNFTVTTTAGYPTATTVTESGSLPAGVSFTDNGDGTATLGGTPAAGTVGTYPVTVTATNSAGHADQAFTLTVNQVPVFTSADHTSFVYGSPGTFTVLTNPGAASITESGTLPAGVTFTDNHDGTATLAGTPSQVGSYPLTLTGSNGPGATTTQAFTLTTTQIPTGTTVTSSTNPSTYGTPVTFTATVTPSNGTGGVSFYRDSSPTAIPACTSQPLTVHNGQYQATCTLTTLGAGTHTLHAVYEGTTIYQASSGDLTGGQHVTQQNQTIHFPPIANRSIVESPFTPTGVTGGNSGNPVTYTATGGNCTTNGTKITLTHTGTCTLTAHQAGTANYTPAPPVTRSFTITSKPTLRIGDSNTTEGNTGTHPLTFRITIDKPVSVPVTVRWVTANGSATAPSDYTNTGGTVTFAPGQTVQTVSVAVKGDRVKEPSEVLFILLSGATNATITDPNASGGIFNDD